jgi:hypothetical protein
VSSAWKIRWCPRRHARLMYEEHRWGFLDIGSRNGTEMDGNRQVVGFMRSGAEIKLGGTTHIAESPRLIELREFLCRLLGWTSERAAAVDLALRMVRLAQLRRTPLFLRGAGDLVTIAQDLHWRVFDAEAPFVVCSARRTTRAALDARGRGGDYVEGGSRRAWARVVHDDGPELREARGSRSGSAGAGVTGVGRGKGAQRCSLTLGATRDLGVPLTR